MGNYSIRRALFPMSKSRREAASSSPGETARNGIDRPPHIGYAGCLRPPRPHGNGGPVSFASRAGQIRMDSRRKVFAGPGACRFGTGCRDGRVGDWRRDDQGTCRPGERQRTGRNLARLRAPGLGTRSDACRRPKRIGKHDRDSICVRHRGRTRRPAHRADRPWATAFGSAWS